jgi:hypothetical protein
MSQFMLETEEDRLAYLDAKYGHGIDAVYTRNGTSSNIVIILNNEYTEQDLGVGVEALKPMATCSSVDVPNASYGDTLNASAVKDTNGNILKAAQNYTIVNVQKDRTGFTVLMLEEI